jgi:hypothetical protein
MGYNEYTQEELKLIWNELSNVGVKIVKNNKNNNLTHKEHSKLIEIINNLSIISKEIKDMYDPHLYLLYSKCNELYKIGITNNIKKRITEIKYQTGLDDLQIIYLLENKGYLESEFHKEFKLFNQPIVGRKNVKHKEWFIPNELILNKFKEYGKE